MNAYGKRLAEKYAKTKITRKIMQDIYLYQLSLSDSYFLDENMFVWIFKVYKIIDFQKFFCST